VTTKPTGDLAHTHLLLVEDGDFLPLGERQVTARPKSSGGIPPASRNHLVPTAADTPASPAASSDDNPRAIPSQNRTRSSRRAVDGRPGDHCLPRIARTASTRSCLPTIPQHLHPRGVATTS